MPEKIPEIVAEPVPEIMAEPIPEIAAEPVPEPAAEPVSEIAADPIPEFIPEPALEMADPAVSVAGGLEDLLSDIDELAAAPDQQESVSDGDDYEQLSIEDMLAQVMAPEKAPETEKTPEAEQE